MKSPQKQYGMSTGSSTSQPVVWLVNKGGHDYSDLERFGRIIPLTTGSVNIFNPDRLMVGMGHHINMAKDSDYLVISGSPLLNAIAVAMWLAKFQHVNLLQHSIRQGKYLFIQVRRAAIEANLKGD